jgi:NitT/TauT family transport system ATP-binding protein
MHTPPKTLERIHMNEQMPLLEVRDLHLGHTSKRKDTITLAVSGLDFEVRQNEMIVAVGPSGCGKTTFLKSVAGLLPVLKGDLVLNGKQINGPGLERSMVFQDASLFPWLTVMENIVYGLRAQGRYDAEGQRRAEWLLELVGLGGRGKAHPAELSGGMAQRVNLARALATDPDLLLLDEPFAALDAQTREVMQEELLRIWQADAVSNGKTAIFITHDVHEAVFLADRVVVFSAGPAHVAEIVDIGFGRPRSPDIKRSPEFLRQADEILDLVMAQSAKGKDSKEKVNS